MARFEIYEKKLTLDEQIRRERRGEIQMNIAPFLVVPLALLNLPVWLVFGLPILVGMNGAARAEGKEKIISVRRKPKLS